MRVKSSDNNPYEAPELQILAQDFLSIICVSYGENEDTQEEEWSTL